MLRAMGKVAGQGEIEQVGNVPDPDGERVNPPGGKRICEEAPCTPNILLFRPAAQRSSSIRTA